MRFHNLMILLVLSMLLHSCGKQEDVLFEIDLEERITVPGGLNNIETHVFAIRDIPNILDSYLDANGVTAENVARLAPATASLQGEFQQYDYSAVATVVVDMLDEDRENRTEIFYQENIPLNQIQSLDLFGSLTDVKEIMSGKNFDLEIGIRFRSTTVLSQNHLFSYKLFAYGE